MVDWVLKLAGWLFKVVERPKGAKGFVLLPRRWVVERTFAWLGRYRRLSKDYEQLPETSEAMIYAAMVRQTAGSTSCYRPVELLRHALRVPANRLLLSGLMDKVVAYSLEEK